MRHATIVGGGVAGLTASLRLLERGYRVTLYEQDDFVGGMLHSYWDEVTQTRREHGYHMFPNFYFNFWRIAEQLGLQEHFVPREGLRFLRRDAGALSELPALYNPGGPQDFLRNLASRAESAPDLFIYMYSMIDLLADPPENRGLLDDYSVNGFLRSRPYMTEAAAQLHQTVWETVWAVASYQASAQSYRNFLRFSNRYSVPEFWFLAGTKWDCLIKPWLDHLESYGDGFQLRRLHRLERVHVDRACRRVEALEFVHVDRSPSVNPGSWSVEGDPVLVDVTDDAVVLAVTPGAMKRLVRDDFYAAAPQLGELQYLGAEPMGAMQLYLRRRLDDVPIDVTEFSDAPYSMTFLDFTALWPDLDTTYLNVSVSDVVALLSLPAERRDEHDELILDLAAPSTAVEFVLIEVLQRLPITLDDVDRRRTAFDMYSGEELFANLVGSWEHRPETATPLQNLWLAGTYVKNDIDVATIEGAVITGSMAAEAIRAVHTPDEEPITILQPDSFPTEMFQAIRLAWAPIVANAKIWSEANRLLGGRAPGWNALQQRFLDAYVKALEPWFGRMPDPPSYLGPLNWTVASRWLPEGDPRAIGPIYWNYNADGTRKPTSGRR